MIEQASCIDDYCDISNLKSYLNTVHNRFFSSSEIHELIKECQIPLEIVLVPRTFGFVITALPKSVAHLTDVSKLGMALKNDDDDYQYYCSKKPTPVAGKWVLNQNDYYHTANINPLLRDFSGDHKISINKAGILLRKESPDGVLKYCLVSQFSLSPTNLKRMVELIHLLVTKDHREVKGTPPVDALDHLHKDTFDDQLHTHLIENAIDRGRFINPVLPDNARLVIHKQYLSKDKLRANKRSTRNNSPSKTDLRKVKTTAILTSIIVAFGIDEEAINRISTIEKYLDSKAAQIGLNRTGESLAKAYRELKKDPDTLNQYLDAHRSFKKIRSGY